MFPLRRCAVPAAFAALFAIVLTARVDTAKPGQQWPTARTGMAGRIDLASPTATGEGSTDNSTAAERLSRARQDMVDVRDGRSSQWAVVGDQWISLGPFGYSMGTNGFYNGLLSAVVPSPVDSKAMFIFPYYGGVLGTKDGGQSWTLLSDRPFSKWVPDPVDANVIFAADLVPEVVGRVLRSDDGGRTWRDIWSNRDNRVVVSLVVDPATAGGFRQRVLAVAEKVLFEFDGSGGAVRTKALPCNASISFVGPGTDEMIGRCPSSAQMLRSTDRGRSWTTVPLPAYPCVDIVPAPSNPSRRYFLGGDSAYSIYCRVYSSDDAGATWSAGYTLFGSPPRALVVSPSDPMTVYMDIGGVSKDGGRTWDIIFGAAGGIRNMAFDREGRLLGAGWSGLFRLDGNSWVDINRGFSAMMFDAVALDPDKPSTVYAVDPTGGLFSFTGAAGWRQRLTRLGGYAFDWKSRQVFQFPLQSATTPGAVSGIRCPLTPVGGGWPQECPAWQFPWQQESTLPVVVSDPSDGSLLLLTTRVYRSRDNGATWTPVSPVLQTDKAREVAEFTYVRQPIWGLTALGISESSPTVMYAGGPYGDVWSTTDGATWARNSSLPLAIVSAIAVHPRDPRVAYVTQKDSPAWIQDETRRRGRVFRTTDGGKSWQNMTGNLPDIDMYDVVIDPDAAAVTVYVASDVGVFRATDGDTNWQVFGRGLPTVPVRDLSYSARTDQLAAATRGRGVYIVSSRYGR